ncbi:MAG: ankyrin repeat domain-containing protein [Candidatus Aminicenantes bacterium]|nr:ankyrin repeat domain-containing protein [Candidatus Aminicenantes bacterium]
MKARKCLVLIMALVVFIPILMSADRIHDEAREGNLDGVKTLLAQNPDLLHAVDKDGRTALHWACRGRNIDLIVFLVEQGADVNAQDSSRIAPLHSLASRGNVDALEYLLQKEAHIDLQSYDGQTPLHLAVQNNQIKAASLLIKKGAGLEIRDNWGRTPLVLCARERGGPELIRLLVEAGAKVNSLDKYVSSAIELAAWRGKEEVVDFLLDSGARVPTKGQKSRMVMSFAASQGLEKLFTSLDIPEIDWTTKLQSGGTFLHEAAAGGSVEIVHKLLKKGLNVNARDGNGWTPLHYAALNGRSVVVEFLNKQGVDLNTRSLMGQSAWNVAKEFEQEEVLEVLRKLKADLSPLQFPMLKGDYLGQPDPGDTPQVFARGIVSSIWGLHSAVAFSPDMNTAMWTPMVWLPGSIYSKSIIYMMERENGVWTAPRIAPFSGRFDDDVPFFAPDGKSLTFISNRALPGNPNSKKERIWMVSRTEEGWGEPEPLDPILNDMPMHWQFSVDSEGTVYFSTRLEGGFGGGDIYRCRKVDGRYIKPENLGSAINSDKGEGTPFIAPDGRYLLFQRDLDLFVSFKQEDGTWSAAVSLGPNINSLGNELCPIVTPDGKYLFFISTRGGENQVWWIDAGIIGG